MRYPIMTEQQLADRWNISTKTLRRWRQEKIGPKWWKLSRHVRYHEEDILAFEIASTQHLSRALGRDESNALVFDPPSAPDEDDPAAAQRLKTAQDVAAMTHLPLWMFSDRAERDRRKIPNLTLVGVVRFDLAGILQWELDNSVPGIPEVPATPVDTEAEQTSCAPKQVPRWYEVVREQDKRQFDSLQSFD